MAMNTLIKLKITCDKVVHQSCRDAEDPHKQVADCQVKDEEVGHSAHASVFHYDQTHQDVTHHAQQKDEGICQDVAGSYINRVLIVGEKSDVGEVGCAIQAAV